MAADGSITVGVDLDDKKAQKELDRLTTKIDKMRDELSQKQETQSGIKAELDAVKDEALKTEKAIARLKSELSDTKKITSGEVDSSPYEFLAARQKQESLTGSLKEQEALLRSQDKETEKIAKQYTKITDSVNKQTDALGKAESRAAELTQQLTHSGDSADAVLERVNKRMDKLGKKMLSMMRRVFVFTVILSALRQIKTYLWDVIRTDSQASAAFAQLKGALMTLAQPLVNIVVPAFTLLMRVLTAVVTQIARIVSMISGKSVDASAKSAKALNAQTKALKGTGKAAKDAGKSLAAFDEINQLSGQSSSSSGGTSSSDIAPDFSFLDGIDDRMKKIADAVLLIGAGLAAWKVSSMLPGTLGTIAGKLAGMAVAIGGLILMFDGLKDAWENGLDWDNMFEILAGATALVGGLTLAFGKTGAGIGLVVSGLAMLVTGFQDAMKNGVNLKNTLTILAGIIGTGLGISLLTKNMLPVLVAGIMAVLYAITTLVGNGDQLMQNFKDIFAGVVEFIDGVINHDFDQVLSGLKKMVKGTINTILTVFFSFVNLIIRGINWLIDKINSISISVPDWVPGIGGKSWSANIPHLDEWTKIPHLAQGAVIPPNREFLAVLGDQKSGTNIETPLATMVQAFKQALSESGYGGGNEAVLMLDRDVLGKVVYRLNKSESNRIGVNLAGV